MPVSELLVIGATWTWLPDVLNVAILLMGLFLMLLVLIQRGKGGGLAGAFGGMGGSSAFGTRAGDQFTRITLTVAAIWILLIMLMIKLIQPGPKTTGDEPPGDKGSSQLWRPDAPAERGVRDV